MCTRGMGGYVFRALRTPEERQEEERSVSQHELGRNIALRNQDSRLRLMIPPKPPPPLALLSPLSHGTGESVLGSHPPTR